MKIILNTPGKDAPGYNRRAYKAMRFQEMLQSGSMTPAMFKELIEFLAEYIVVEFGPNEPTISNFDALFDYASEEDMQQLMSALAGGGAQVPPVS